MTFADDIRDDFETILTGEFSVGVVFSSPAGEEKTTSGIFDDTHEEVSLESGEIVIARSYRITVHADNLSGYNLQENYLAVISGKSYRVHEVREESEGNVLVILRDV